MLSALPLASVRYEVDCFFHAFDGNSCKNFYTIQSSLFCCPRCISKHGNNDDDVTYYVTHRILNSNLTVLYFVVNLGGKKSSLGQGV